MRGTKEEWSDVSSMDCSSCADLDKFFKYVQKVSRARAASALRSCIRCDGRRPSGPGADAILIELMAFSIASSRDLDLVCHSELLEKVG